MLKNISYDIIRCNNCGWLGLDRESSYCPRCGRNDCIMDLDGTEEWYSQEQIKELWNIFGDIPINLNTEEIEDIFLYYPVGTHIEEIWHWFDERYNGGVYKLLHDF